MPGNKGSRIRVPRIVDRGLDILSDITSSDAETIPTTPSKEVTFKAPFDKGDVVSINFKKFGHISKARIFKVQFADNGKVLFDVIIAGEGVYQKLYGVDSVYCS